MIISKPQRRTIFALLVSTLICGLGSIYFMRQVLEEPATWKYIVLGILLFCASILIYKLLFNYKVLKISHDQVHVYYPFRFFKSVQSIKELGAWQEVIIETNKTQFRELKLVFKNKGFVKITNQENSEYDKVYKYIRKKAPKLEVKE